MAATRAANALRQATELDLPGVRFGAHLLLAELAIRAGLPDRALDESAKSIELADLCELPFERALAQIRRSEALMAAGMHSEARLLLNEAMGTLSLLEANPVLRRAEVLASSMGLSTPELERRSDLSERELDVLRLIVAGRSNQAIADELFISWTTARTHVSHILRKLGASTRAEAVDVAHRRGLVGPPEAPSPKR